MHRGPFHGELRLQRSPVRSSAVDRHAYLSPPPFIHVAASFLQVAPIVYCRSTIYFPLRGLHGDKGVGGRRRLDTSITRLSCLAETAKLQAWLEVLRYIDLPALAHTHRRALARMQMSLHRRAHTMARAQSVIRN